jgi:hypothetical protein
LIHTCVLLCLLWDTQIQLYVFLCLFFVRFPRVAMRVAMFIFSLLYLSVTAAEPFYLCSITGNNGSICDTIGKTVGPNLAIGRVVELTTYFGALPCIGCTAAHADDWCNGRIPQLANLSWHAAKIKQDLDLAVPPDFDGILDVDYESWWPKWNLTSDSYRNGSRALARSQLPQGASDGQVELKAVSDYDSAALNFFVYTAQQVQQQRPKATVGYYGFPTAPYYHYNLTLLTAMNRALLPLWRQIDVLMPSLYLPYQSGTNFTPLTALHEYVDHRLGMAAQVNEMLSAEGSKPRKVVPYTWYRYHGSSEPYALQLLNDNDTALEFSAPELTRAVDGAIIWGSEKTAQQAKEVEGYFQVQRDLFRGGGAPQRTNRTTTAARVEATAARTTAAAVAAGTGLRSPPPVDPRGPVPPWKSCGL